MNKKEHHVALTRGRSFRFRGAVIRLDGVRKGRVQLTIETDEHEVEKTDLDSQREPMQNPGTRQQPRENLETRRLPRENSEMR